MRSRRLHWDAGPPPDGWRGRSTRSRRRRSPSRGCRRRRSAAGSRTSRRCLLFIFVVNLLGFIPLPLTGETWHGMPVWGIYAATSSLVGHASRSRSLTFVFTHFEGIRWNGPVRYFKSWIPEAPKALLAPDRAARDPRPVHAPDLAQRPSLREHARRAHPDPHVPGPDLHLPSRWFLAVLVIPSRSLFYLFEVVIVVGIQAFIFAALSAIYIGSAIEPQH